MPHQDDKAEERTGCEDKNGTEPDRSLSTGKMFQSIDHRLRLMEQKMFNGLSDLPKEVKDMKRILVLILVTIIATEFMARFFLGG